MVNFIIDKVSLEQICAFNKPSYWKYIIWTNLSLQNEPNVSALRCFNLYFSKHEHPVTDFCRLSQLY